MRARVKICGIKRVEDLEAAVAEGADAVGMVVGFPSSPRNLRIDEAAEIRRRVPLFIDAVLVTQAKNIEELRWAVEKVQPDALQLYGPLAVGVAKEAAPSCRVIKPLKAGDEPTDLEVMGADAVLLDSHSAGLPGGSGRTHDWFEARRVKERVGLPLILAGGLNPTNVREAIRVVKPYAVDVSSGVESSPGVKSRELIRAFISAVVGEEIDG
ncbi:MAG: phosphoribosylanthranilate isomerase [Nitrososphaerota archaeon]